MKFFRQFLLFPTALSLLAPVAVEAIEALNSSNHGPHSDHAPRGDIASSTMLMGKTTFVVGGVDDVTSMGTAKDETIFNFDMKLMDMPSFTGKDMFMTAIR